MTTQTLLLACTLALPLGCAKSEPQAEIKSPEAPALQVSLHAIDAQGFQAAIAAEHGKVVLVDFWATWCGPCQKQFPHTVDLHNELQSRGLSVISVSFDEQGTESQVLAFLKKRGASFQNFQSNYKSGVTAVEAFNLPGPVPCYRVYDRQGKLRHEFAIEPRAKKQFSQEDIKAAVLELL